MLDLHRVDVRAHGLLEFVHLTEMVQLIDCCHERRLLTDWYRVHPYYPFVPKQCFYARPSPSIFVKALLNKVFSRWLEMVQFGEVWLVKQDLVINDFPCDSGEGVLSIGKEIVGSDAQGPDVHGRVMWLHVVDQFRGHE